MTRLRHEISFWSWKEKQVKLSCRETVPRSTRDLRITPTLCVLEERDTFGDLRLCRSGEGVSEWRDSVKVLIFYSYYFMDDGWGLVKHGWFVLSLAFSHDTWLSWGPLVVIVSSFRSDRWSVGTVRVRSVLQGYFFLFLCLWGIDLPLFHSRRFTLTSLSDTKDLSPSAFSLPFVQNLSLFRFLESIRFYSFPVLQVCNLFLCHYDPWHPAETYIYAKFGPVG